MTVRTSIRNSVLRGIGCLGVCATGLLPQVGSAASTNVWKADSGGSWQDTANWSDASLVGTACYVDLSRVPDGGTVTVSSTPTIYGLIATNDSETVKTITLKHASSGCLLILKGPSSSYKATDFTLKNVRLVLEHYFSWDTGNSDFIQVLGSGSTVVFKNTSPHIYRYSSGNRVNFYLKGTDNFAELASLRGAERMNLQCNANTGLKLAADTEVGELSVNASARGVWLNGHTLRLGGRSANSTFSADVFKDEGFVSAVNGANVTVNVGQTGAVGYRALDGQLTLASSAVTTDTTLESEGHGEIAFGGAASVAILRSGSVGLTGAVNVPADAELTVNGTGAATTTVYRAKVTGGGGFVKKGADYTLTLQGGNDYQGATKVKEGALVVSRPYPTRATGLVADWKFDDATDIGHDSSGNGMTLKLFNTSGITIVDDADRGKVVRLERSKKSYLAANMGDNKAFPFGDAPYTLSFWVKTPEGSSMDMLVYWGGTANLKGVICGFYWGNGFQFENRGNAKVAYKWLDWEGGTPYNFHDGQWHHVVQTYDNGVRRAYIDGVKRLDDTTGPLDVASSNLYLGWGGCGESYVYFDGCLDDFRVYDFALDAAEVADEFAHGTRATRGAPSRFDETYAPAPVARYAFEDETNIGKDSVGGADMTQTEGDVATVYDAERGGHVLDLSADSLEHLTLSSIPDTFPTGDHNVTITCWVRPYDGFKTTDAAVFHYGDATTYAYDTGLLLSYSKDNELPVLYFGAKGGSTSDPATPVRNAANGTRKWYHIACAMHTGSDYQKLYVDGTCVGTTWFGSAAHVANGIFRLGNRPDKTVGFRGWIDDVRVYDKALSADEIKRIMAEETSKATILPQGTDLTVDAGASVKFTAVSESIGALNGSGTVKVADGSVLEVTGQSVFDGTLETSSGWVRLGSGGSIRRTDGAAFAGDFALAEGMVVKVADGASNLPVVKTTGGVSFPATGTVTLADGASVPPIGKYVLVEAGRLLAPADLSGWTFGGKLADARCRLKLDGNRVVLKVSGGFVMVIR